MRSWSVFLVMLVVGTVSQRAHAQQSPDAPQVTFDLGNTTLTAGTGERIIDAFAPQLSGRGQGPAIEAQLNPIIADLGAQLQADVLAKINALNLAPFVQAMGNAAALAARTMAVDHATKYKLLSLTVGGAGVANTALLNRDHDLGQDYNNIANGVAPTYGLSAQAAVTLGINLAAFHLPQAGLFDPDRMQIFASGMYLAHGNAAVDQYRFRLNHWSLLGKYQFLRPVQLVPLYNFVHWGGLNVATGFTYADQDIDVQADLPRGSASTATKLQNANKSLAVQYSYEGSGTVGTHSALYSIPVEVSSSLQLLYFLTLYLGGAVDFAWGHTDVTASASEPTHITLSDGQGTTLDLLDPMPTLTFAQNKPHTHVSARGFAGVQINAGVLALFAQADIASTRVVAGSLGLRIFY
jgi:hypothetical protein